MRSGCKTEFTRVGHGAATFAFQFGTRAVLAVSASSIVRGARGRRPSMSTPASAPAGSSSDLDIDIAPPLELALLVTVVPVDRPPLPPSTLSHRAPSCDGEPSSRPRDLLLLSCAAPCPVDPDPRGSATAASSASAAAEAATCAAPIAESTAGPPFTPTYSAT